MAFEQYFYTPARDQIKIDSESEIELNKGGPYRKCYGGIKAVGDAECELKKRKYYSIKFSGDGVELSEPTLSRVQGMFSGANIEEL